MAEYRPKHRGLERVLGTGALFSTAYGNVGSSIYYALGLVAIFALGMTPVVFLIAGLIFACTAATYTEATTMFPEAGGSSSFARRAFNEFWSALTAWGQMLNYIITVAISAFFLPHDLGVVWEPLLTAPGDILCGVAVVLILGAVNIVEEARDYGRTVPQAMRLVVVAVMAISLTLPAVALSAMPVENGETLLALSSEEGGYANNPIQGVVVNLGLGDGLQSVGEVYVGLLASTILLVATNAGLIGLSRLSYSMGQYRQLPERLRQLHPKFRTPYVAIVVFGGIACLTMLPGEAEFLGTVYAFGAMLGFTVAHASVVALRIKEPER